MKKFRRMIRGEKLSNSGEGKYETVENTNFPPAEYVWNQQQSVPIATPPNIPQAPNVIVGASQSIVEGVYAGRRHGYTWAVQDPTKLADGDDVKRVELEQHGDKIKVIIYKAATLETPECRITFFIEPDRLSIVGAEKLVTV